MRQRKEHAVVEEKSPQYTDQEKDAISEAVGVSAVRYADLSQNPQSDVTFSWDKNASLDGNTAPSLMYGYARGRGIQRKVGVTNPNVEQLKINDDSGERCVTSSIKVSICLRDGTSTKKPNLLCDYLFDCANKFNRSL